MDEFLAVTGEGGVQKKSGIYPVQRARFREQIVPLVEGAPAEGELGRVAFPGLQVRGGPDHVEHREEHVADVLQSLVAAVAAQLFKNAGEIYK